MIYEKVTVEKVIMNLFSRPVMESLFRRQKIYQGTSSRFRSGKEFPGFKVPRSETWPGKAHRTVQKVDRPNDEVASSTNFNGSIPARRIETLPGFCYRACVCQSCQSSGEAWKFAKSSSKSDTGLQNVWCWNQIRTCAGNLILSSFEFHERIDNASDCGDNMNLNCRTTSVSTPVYY